MTNPYKIVVEYRTDRMDDWKRLLFHVGWAMVDSDDDVLIAKELCNLPFDDVIEAIRGGQINPSNGIGYGKTFFLKRPYIYTEDNIDPTRYFRYHFDRFSYRIRYIKCSDLPLSFIFNTFTAEETIKYLQDRGLHCLPINGR